MKTKIYLCALAALFMIPQAMTAQTKKKAKKEVAIQLYSVRDILNKVDNKNGKCDPTYTALLKKLANMGYTGVEAANYNNGKFYDRTPQQFKKDVESAGLKVLSSHCTRQLSKEELASGDLSESLQWWDQCIADHKAAGMKYIVALDQGTTSSRAVVFDERARLVASHAIEFPQIYPKPGWVEHRPQDILDSQLGALKLAVEKSGVNVADIAAIGITNQRETTRFWER